VEGSRDRARPCPRRNCFRDPSEIWARFSDKSDSTSRHSAITRADHVPPSVPAVLLRTQSHAPRLVLVCHEEMTSNVDTSQILPEDSDSDWTDIDSDSGTPSDSDSLDELGGERFLAIRHFIDPPRSGPQDSISLRSKCSHFRILVVGRANAGKTTLLKKVCNSVDDPEIFDARGKKVCARRRLSGAALI
jgi:hypothetical protein